MSSTQIKDRKIPDGTQSQWSLCMQDICMVPQTLVGAGIFGSVGYKAYEAGSNWGVAGVFTFAALAVGCYLVVSAIKNRPQKKSFNAPAP
jgi:hypothetical protein